MTMDQAFACPECGTAVQVQGLAPGRQVRCEFCQRLLEVPYMPRVAEPMWKRRRYGKPWWVRWAWTALGALGAAIVLSAAVRLIQNRERQALARSIDRLAASSEQHEAGGDLEKALLDIDTAINMCSGGASDCADRRERLRARRQDLAKRGVQSRLEELKRRDPGSFPLGDWLNLQARVSSDHDLTQLQPHVESAFQDRLRQRIESGLATARGAFEAGKPLKAFEHCEAMKPFWAHLPQSDNSLLLKKAEEVVVRIVERNGIVIDPIRGHFLVGTNAGYGSTTLPELIKGVKAKGYVPAPASSPWSERWSQAPYHLSLELNERLVGNYMTSENRLTRIDADLRLSHRGREFWQTTPSVRTSDPLPKLPASVATRLALSHDRIEEIERLLYEDARSQIDGRLAFALVNMPNWTQAPH
jgi:hypothetical protein